MARILRSTDQHKLELEKARNLLVKTNLGSGIMC